MVRTPLWPITAGIGFSSLAITLLYLAVLGTGVQIITADRNTRYSDSSDEYKGV